MDGARMNITLKQLEYFMEVAQTLSFSRAAENLYMSQSALSRSIIALEESLGTTLFFRNKQGVSMTPAGAILASRLPHLSRELEDTFERVKQVKEGLRGHLSVGIATGMMIPEIILSAILYCQKSMPFVQIEPVNVDSGALAVALRSGQVDFAVDAILDGAPQDPRTSRLVLEESPMKLAVAAGAILQDNPSPEALSELDYAFVGDRGDYGPQRWLHYCRSNGFVPRMHFYKDVTTCASRVEMGLNHAVFPEGHRIFKSGYIKSVALSNFCVCRTELIWNTNTLNPIVEMFLRLIESDL